MRQVLILGASSDIGVALCRCYLDHGYSVIAHYWNGQKSFFDLVESDQHIELLKIDFSDIEELDETIATHREMLQRSDVIVNATGLLESIAFTEITADAILRAMSVNVVSGLLILKEIVPSMLERRWGRILQLSSIGVKYGGGKSSFCYALSKHASEFIPGEYREWASRNVLINVVRVGVTDTRIHKNEEGKNFAQRVELVPQGRPATPYEMAQALYWHASESNSFCTGQTIAISGGE